MHPNGRWLHVERLDRVCVPRATTGACCEGQPHHMGDWRWPRNGRVVLIQGAVNGDVLDSADRDDLVCVCWMGALFRRGFSPQCRPHILSPVPVHRLSLVQGPNAQRVCGIRVTTIFPSASLAPNLAAASHTTTHAAALAAAAEQSLRRVYRQTVHKYRSACSSRYLVVLWEGRLCC